MFLLSEAREAIEVRQVGQKGGGTLLTLPPPDSVCEKSSGFKKMYYLKLQFLPPQIKIIIGPQIIVISFPFKRNQYIPLYHIREGNGTLLQYSCLANPMDGEAW